MERRYLKIIDATQLATTRQDPVDEDTIRIARSIIDDVRTEGEEALRAHGLRLGDLGPSDPLYYSREDLQKALQTVSADTRLLLERTAERIRVFAEAQRKALQDIEVAIPGGRAGHRAIPFSCAGCYAPGGRFPLPSSVLMTAVTAKAAGVKTVWVASPKPTMVTLAAAAIADADGLLAVGGAQAVAAFAYGAGAVPPCEIIVGPGNRFVTAAKQIVSSRVAIDMLAGPSELLVIADASADPAVIADDLLAQAEHDPDACPILITTDGTLPDRVESALHKALADLSTAEIARKSLNNGFVVVAKIMDEAIALSDAIAAEHVEVLTVDAEKVAKRLTSYGGLFIGPYSAEVIGDYGAGPNHVLPTFGVGRFRGGLSALDFMAVRTWMCIDDPAAANQLYQDAEVLARIEGLEAHARAAARRLK